MKICIIGPGLMSIPPEGWGAVEALVWDYICELKLLGHDVHLINTQNLDDVVRETHEFNPDVVHLHYDEYIHIFDRINCPIKIATSHFPYLEQPRRWGLYYGRFMRKFVDCGCYIFALSPGIRDFYIKFGCAPERVKVTPNGARNDLFRYNPLCAMPDRSMYLAKVEPRKRQSVVQKYGINVDFAGRLNDQAFNTNDPCYLGEWTKAHLYDNLTNYANLVLLSDGEAHALVLPEALMAGLGLVLSEYASANMDASQEFIDIIPNSRLDDHDYIKQVVIENRKRSVACREQIRQYALDHFDWKKLVNNYAGLLETLV